MCDVCVKENVIFQDAYKRFVRATCECPDNDRPPLMSQSTYKERTKKEKWHLYVIRIKGSNVCKIGIALSPKKRMASLAQTQPHDLELIEQFEIGSQEDAGTLERFFHNQFRKERIKGEWFEFEKVNDVLVTIKDRVNFSKTI